MDGFAARRVAALPLGQVGRVLPMAADRWLVQRSKADELLVVDAQLAPLWRLHLPAPDLGVDAATDEPCDWEHEHGLPYREHGTHAVTNDLSLVALALRRQVLVLDGDGQQVRRFPHPPWPIGASGCCAFSPDGHSLWAVVPPRPERFFAGSAELWLIDLRVMQVVDWRKLEASPAGCQPVRHPDGQTIGLDIGEGQDGSLIRWTRADRGRIDLRFGPERDQGLTAVHPDGLEYLTTPHPCGADTLVRHHFADDRPIEELTAADALDPDERWDFHAGYLTDTLILASIVETDQHSGRHVLVQQSPMRLSGEVTYPAGQPPGWIAGPHQGTWLTIDDHGLQHWTLAE